MSMQPDLDASDVLTRPRINAAFGSLADSSAENGALHLDESERNSITAAIRRSDHHLGGFAQTVLEQWDQLEADEQVAGLLLFAEIASNPRRQQDRSRGLER